MTYCCEVFPKIAKRFGWYDGSDDGDKIYPYIRDLEMYEIDIDFCPSCGADIRGIVISKDEFDKLK